MATYEIADAVGFDVGSAVPSANTAKARVEKVELDFAAIIAARAAAGATALATNDVIECLHIPAHTMLLGAGMRVTSVESTNTTGTFDLGDGSDPNGFTTILANNALASEGNVTILTKYYATADSVDISLITAAPTDCVVEVWAVLADCT